MCVYLYMRHLLTVILKQTLYSNLDLSNPNIPPPEVDTSLVKLYDDIRITVRKEANIISAVFPQPATVMQVFLQRVFAQSVSGLFLCFFVCFCLLLKPVLPILFTITISFYLVRELAA